MVLMVSPLLVPISASERMRSSMLASLGSSVRACARRRSRISFSCLNWARLLAMDCFWISSSSSARSCLCRCVTRNCIRSTMKYQLAAVSRTTKAATTPTFWPRGILLTELRMSCPVSAIGVFASGGVVGVADDGPADYAVRRRLLRALDGDVGEMGAGLELLGEAGEVLVARGQADQGHPAVLFGVVGDPHLLRDQGGQLVQHLDRAGAALLQGIEDLQLVLERLLVFLDRLDLADGLLQLRDLGAGGSDVAVQLGELARDAAVPEVVADGRQRQEQDEEEQLLPAEFPLLGGADGKEVDPDHRALLTARWTCAGQARWPRPPRATRPSRSWGRTSGCRSPPP